MSTRDLFPEELAAAQRELAEQNPYEDEKREVDNMRYWFWDDSDYAAQVCVKRWGPL